MKQLAGAFAMHGDTVGAGEVINAALAAANSCGGAFSVKPGGGLRAGGGRRDLCRYAGG